MKTLNLTNIFHHVQVLIKHSARALTLGTWLAAGTALPASGKTVLWNLAGGGDWDFTTFNWLEQPSGPASTFADGDDAIFNNVAGGTISIPSAVTPLSTTVSAASGDYAFSGGPLAGTGSLTKSDSGTLTLNSPNTYSGSTVVNGGTLVATGNGALGSSASFTVATGATLQLNGTNAGGYMWPAAPATLTGDGTVNIPLGNYLNVGSNFDMSAFTGTLNLTSANGAMAVNPFFSPGFTAPLNGTINIGNNTTLYLGWQGTTYNTTVKLSGGTDNGEGYGVLRGDNATLNGAVILATNSTIGSAGGTLTINSVISDGGNGFGFTTVGGGATVILTAATNTYTGPTTVNSGTLEVNGNGAVGGSTSFSVATGATLQLNGTNASSYMWPAAPATLTGDGTVNIPLGNYLNVGSNFDMSAFTGTLNLTSANGMMAVNPFFSPEFTAPLNGTINIGNNTTLYLGWQGTTYNTTVKLSGGTDNGEGYGVLRGDNATLNGAVILATNSTIGSAGGTLTINSVISDGGSGFGFTTVGGGGTTVILTAANTYTGPTAVNSGATLRCDTPGSLGGGALSINGMVNLNYAGTKTVASLTLAGTPKAPGVYGSSASAAPPANQDDARFAGTGTVTVGSDYDMWAAAYLPTDVSDPAADNDGDGLSNQEEYAFGLNPTLGTAVNPITVPLNKTTGMFTYTRRATPAATGLTYTVQTSTDLAIWPTDVTATQNVTGTVGDVQTVEVTVTGAPLTAPSIFVRIKAAP